MLFECNYSVIFIKRDFNQIQHCMTIPERRCHEKVNNSMLRMNYRTLSELSKKVLSVVKMEVIRLGH